MGRVTAAVFAVLVGLLGLVAWIRSADSATGGAASGASRSAVSYTCPMHPQYRSPQPGECPTCGMRLVPSRESSVESRGAYANETVHVPPAGQRLIGVRTARVDMSPVERVLRTTGRVAPDENRLYRLSVSSEIWVRKLYPPVAGSTVRKDEPLLEFYTPNFFSASTAFMYALNTRDRQMRNDPKNEAQLLAVDYQMRQAIEGLRNLGMSPTDIDEMERTRKPRDLVTLRAPVGGVVLSRNATTGQWVGASAELYQIADLSRIWIIADVFANEARQIQPGMPVKATARDMGVSFPAKVGLARPAFDPATRTSSVRLEAENPGATLWPGMFVDVEFPIHRPAAITVPADAVVDSGLKKTVFVARGDGDFEPRIVETGWRFGDLVEITKGLKTGEQIVVSGNFLLDSESRMRMAAAPQPPPDSPSPTPRDKDSAAVGRGSPKTIKDIVCGMDVDPAEAAGKSIFRGATYYFCSNYCKKEFDAHPGKYIAGTAPETHTHD